MSVKMTGYCVCGHTDADPNPDCERCQLIARLDAALALLRRAAVHVPAYYELRREIDAATGEAGREGGGR